MKADDPHVKVIIPPEPEKPGRRPVQGARHRRAGGHDRGGHRGGHRDRRRGTGKRVRWLALGFLFPALLLLGALVVYPIVYSVFRSLFDASGDTFVGAGNYTRIFTDDGTLVAIRNTVIWVVIAPSVVTVLGLIFAVLTERIRWASAFKLVVFMPMAVSFLASGVVFRLVYEQDPDKGTANAVMVTVHDTFASSAVYPGARPRPNSALVPEGRPGGGSGETGTEGGSGTGSGPLATGYATRESVQPGRTVLLPLVGVDAERMPADVRPVRPPAPAGADAISGAVWLDFTRGGGGASGRPDATERGMPGMKVQAMRDGRVVGTATTRPDGGFTIGGLPAGGDYVLLLPRGNFTAPYQGVTWLGPTLVTPAIIGAYVWIWAGFAMVLIAAGLAAIPRELLEAARVDGAGEWHIFRRITVPLLAPVLMVVFVTLMINVLKVFDLVFIIAPGPVQPDANVLALEMWRVSYGGGADQGAGSALAVFLFLLVLPAMIFNVRRFRREQR